MLALLASLAFAHPPTSKSLDALIEIQVFDAQSSSWASIGTGAYIKDSRIGGYGVLTAEHIYASTQTDTVRGCFISGDCVQLTNVVVEQIGATDQLYDWAVYPIEKQSSHTPVRVARRVPRLGDSVWTVGYPLGLFRYGDGTVTGITMHKEIPLDLTIMKGSSGSPVFNAKNKVICVVEAYDNTTPYDYPLYYPVFNRSYCVAPF